MNFVEQKNQNNQLKDDKMLSVEWSDYKWSFVYMKILISASLKTMCVHAYQPFTGHDAGKVDHLQMGRL